MNFIDLLDLMSESPIILIGYSFKNERSKDRLLKKVNAISINEDFNFKKFNRDDQINIILDSEEKIDTKYLVLDLNLHNNYLISVGKISDSFLRTASIRRIIEDLRSDIVNTVYRLIIVAATNKISKDSSIYSRGPVEVADLALVINESNKIDIIKNRRGAGLRVLHSKDIAF